MQVLITRFVKNGCCVSVPIGDNNSYNFIVDINNSLYRVQVVTAERVINGKMIFYTNVTNPFKKTKELFDRRKIDLIGLYCIENDFVGLIEIDNYKAMTTTLRIDKPKNNNVVNVNFADDYEFCKIFKNLN